MRLLLDTHLLLAAAAELPGALSPAAIELIDDPANDLLFSPASIWEVAIKNALGRADFQVDPHLLCRGLVDSGYEELPISASHALAVAALPARHKDPFDRMLIAQATAEGVTLLTSDAQVSAYPGPIRAV